MRLRRVARGFQPLEMEHTTLFGAAGIASLVKMP